MTSLKNPFLFVIMILTKGGISVFFNRILYKFNIVYVLTISIPLILFTTIFYNFYKGELEEREINASMNQTEQVCQILDEIIQQLDTACLSVYLKPELSEYFLYRTPYVLSNEYSNFTQHQRGYDYIENLFGVINKNIRYISAVNYNGETISMTRTRAIRPNHTLSEEPYFKPLFESKGELVILPQHYSLYMFTSNKKVFAVGRRLYNTSYNIFMGSIIMEYDAEQLSELFTLVGTPSNSDFIVTDANKELIYTTMKGQKIPDELASFLHEDHEPFEKITYQGIPYVLTHNHSRQQLIVYNLIPYDLILDSLRPVKITFTLLTVVCILLILIITSMVSRQITKPIFTLQKGMRDVEAGQTGLVLPVKSQDELGQLTRSFNHLVSQLHSLLFKIRTIQLKKREAELTALQSQINPHFLYNTLDSIRMMALIEEKQGIASSLESLASLFRYTTKFKRDVVSFCHELEHMEHYLSLHKLKYDERLQVHLHLDPELDQIKIIKLTLQPLVENAFKHGFGHKRICNHLFFSASESEGILTIKVVDNGKGMNQEELKDLYADLDAEQPKGLGLPNIHQRYKAYFGSAYSLTIESKQHHYTSFTLRLPAYTDEKKVMKDVIRFIS